MGNSLSENVFWRQKESFEVAFCSAVLLNSRCLQCFLGALGDCGTGGNKLDVLFKGRNKLQSVFLHFLCEKTVDLIENHCRRSVQP